MQILECSTGAYIYWGNQLSGNWNQSFILYSNELDNYWPFLKKTISYIYPTKTKLR